MSSAQVFTPLGLKRRLFVCEGNDIILNSLLLQLLQLFRCSFGVEGLGLHHGCVCYSCENKDGPLSLICVTVLQLLLVFVGRMILYFMLFSSLRSFSKDKIRNILAHYSLDDVLYVHHFPKHRNFGKQHISTHFTKINLQSQQAIVAYLMVRETICTVITVSCPRATFFIQRKSNDSQIL